MEITARALWTLIHGLGFGALYLLACSGALVELYRFTTSSAPSEPTATQERFLKVYLLAMVVFAWAAVLTGAYVIYPWYRAAPPSGAADLSIFSEKNGALRSLHHIRSRFATPMLPQDSSCRLSWGILLGSHMRTETILMRRTCDVANESGRRITGMAYKVSPPLPPYLIDIRGVQCCSVCKQAFDRDSTLSLSSAFNKHVLEVHGSIRLYESGSAT
jgi:hypothetical protein